MPTEVIYTVGGKRVPSGRALAGEIGKGMERGIAAWMGEIETDLHGNTGAIWPYLTGASSEGFEIVKDGSGGYAFENEEDYAAILEERGGYIVRLLDERDADLDRAMSGELEKL